MLTALDALIYLVAYGICVAGAGFYFLSQERLERRVREEELKRIAQLARFLIESQHAKLTTDTGEEVDVFLQSATGR